jgi:two-component system, chemotaxis family, protein-glutamate methylesterase/glutaminase
MNTIRVMLVDDSAIARRVTTAALAEHPEIEVVATVPTGALALRRLDEVNPDAIILDVEMPGMDGIDTLRRIRETHPRLPVIMFSVRTERGARITVEALSSGASDYVCKPSALENTTPEGVVSDEIVPKLLALCRGPAASRSVRPEPRVMEASLPPLRPSTPPRHIPPEVVVIGCSTGGPNALCELIPRLPGKLASPICLVQHMPAVFTRHLAERLDQLSELKVREAAGDEEIRAGEVWIAPGDFHLEVVRVKGSLRTRLHQGPRENSCRPAADVLFRSAAAVAGSQVVGVILTGMGQDGLEGARALCQVGAKVLAQDEQSSVVWGMPRAVVQAGLADVVGPLNQLADEIVLRVAGQRRLGGAA